MSALTDFIYSRSTNDGSVCFIFLLVFFCSALCKNNYNARLQVQDPNGSPHIVSEASEPECAGKVCMMTEVVMKFSRLFLQKLGATEEKHGNPQWFVAV
jgi:hypothetical protein